MTGLPDIKSTVQHRKYEPGFEPQQYAIKAFRFITKEAYDTFLDGSMSSHFDEWVDKINRFIYDRAERLGLDVDWVKAQLVEEPNEHRAIEAAVWEQRGAVAVWTVWAYLVGPVLAQDRQEAVLPLYGFWPNESLDISGCAEIFNAEMLSAAEQAGADLSPKIFLS